MKAVSTIIFCLAVQLVCVNAHTFMGALQINGNKLSDGDCVRPNRPYDKEYPIMGVYSADMTCGFVPWNLNPSNRKCPVAAGSTVGLQWYHNTPVANPIGDQVIAESHSGPCMVYMAKSESGLGNVWFKVGEEGYDQRTKTWCVDRLRTNGGIFSFTIPNDIAPGNYLIRGELIALHEGYAEGLSQQYVGCAEVTVTGSGSSNPSGVAFPGYYSPTDPGILFNLYNTISNYIIPGPALYKSGSASAPTSAPTPAATQRPTSAPTTAPTPAPTPAATQRPTSAPTTAPTPASTQRPGSGATSAPTAPSGGIVVQMSSSSSAWWVAVYVDSGDVTTSTLEIKDTAMSNYAKFETTTWGYWVYSPSSQLVTPISIRLTSSSGQQVVLNNFFTSFSNFDRIRTGISYTSTGSPSTSAPTTAPTSAPTPASTPAPTTAPTPAPTTAPTPAPTRAPTNPPASTPAPSGRNVQVQIHSGSTEWWLAVAVLNTDKVSKVEAKDSGAYSSWSSLSSTNWGYYIFNSQGAALTSPVTIRITSTDGKVATATAAISGGAIVDTGSSF